MSPSEPELNIQNANLCVFEDKITWEEELYVLLFSFFFQISWHDPSRICR